MGIGFRGTLREVGEVQLRTRRLRVAAHPLGVPDAPAPEQHVGVLPEQRGADEHGGDPAELDPGPAAKPFLEDEDVQLLHPGQVQEYNRLQLRARGGRSARRDPSGILVDPKHHQAAGPGVPVDLVELQR